MKLNQQAFTIIELMIATVIFAVILTLTTTAIIGISNTYVKGNVQSQTQDSARAVLTDISQAIQFNDPYYVILSGLNPTTNEYYFCLGQDVYVYQLDRELVATPTSPGQSDWALVRYTASCPSSSSSLPADPADTVAGSQELLAYNERLGQLAIAPITINNTNAYIIKVEIGYGDDDLLNDVSYNSAYLHGNPVPPLAGQYNITRPYVYRCATGTDSSFCSVSSLTTTVTPRINNNE